MQKQILGNVVQLSLIILTIFSILCWNCINLVHVFAKIIIKIIYFSAKNSFARLLDFTHSYYIEGAIQDGH